MHICKFKNVVTDFPHGPVIRIPPSNARGAGLIPSWRAKIPHALRPTSQGIKQKQYCDTLSKDLKKKKKKQFSQQSHEVVVSLSEP